MIKNNKSFLALIETLSTVTDPVSGCPWLHKHNSHKSLASYLIEEAYEVSEAIESSDNEKILDELGDILLQVLLHGKIASENKTFTLDDVMDNLAKKIVRRHPHIFEEKSDLNMAEIEEQWELIKKEEKKNLSAVASEWEKKLTKNFPATKQAKELGRRAREINFDWDKPEDVLEKLKSELFELDMSFKEDKDSGDLSHIEEEIGDLYFTLAQFCRHLDLDPERSAFLGNLKFCRRIDKMHELSGSSDLKNKKKEELEQLWSKVKEELDLRV